MGFFYKKIKFHPFTFILSLSLIIFLLLPVLIFFFKISSFQWPNSEEWTNVLINTGLQASFSTLLPILLGIPGALGLMAFSRSKYIRLLECFCLLPAFLPPLVIVLAYVNVWEWFERFSYSLKSVIFIHALMNTGLASVFLYHLFCTQSQHLSSWAYLHKISRWHFLKVLILHEYKIDIALLFILIGAFCFTSFSVPLLVGGVDGQTLEVLIAEKLKNPDHWSEALALFGIEFLFLFILFISLYRREKKPLINIKNKNILVLPTPPLLFFAIFPSTLLCIGLLDLGWLVQLWQNWPIIRSPVILSTLQTFLTGMGTGILALLFLVWTAFCQRHFFLRQFLIAYAGSSTAFMAFVFLLTGGEGFFWTWCKWIIGLSLLFLPALYRFMGEPVIRRLERQIKVASLMGVSWINIFLHIVLPQCIKSFLFLAGIASFWACGDFAYSGIVSSEYQHLAMLIQDLFSSYHFELATILIWLLLSIGFLCFSLFAGVALVFYKKSYLQTG